MRLATILTAGTVLVLGALSFLSPAHAQSFSNHIFNGANPTRSGGEVIFSVQEGQCSPRDYGDGRGESDCGNGNIRSRIHTGRTFNAGTAIEYAMDIWIDPSFTYNGGNSARSRLEIAEWQRINTIKNHMYEMHLDSRRGVTFEDKVCFSPSEFGQWNTFVVQALWSQGADGILQVICNGAVIYQTSGPNLVPPGCGTSTKLQCDTALLDLRQPVQWQVGPMMRGYGMEFRRYGFSSAFAPFPPNGINMRLRNLYEGRIRPL